MREPALRQKAIGPVQQGPDFGRAQKWGQLNPKWRALVESGPQSLDCGQQGRSDRLARKVPDDGPQFVLFVKADAMIDQPDMSIGGENYVTGLAIGVVDQEIK
jgi:hypothetical protein